MEEPETKNAPKNATLVRSTSRRSTPGRSTPGRSISSMSTSGRSTSGRSPSGRSISGKSISGRSTPGRSTPDRSTTPEPPPVPPATYHWEEVRRKRSEGGYPWTHLDKPPFDEKSWVKYERDHVYEPVTPTVAGADRTASSQAAKQTRDEGRHFLRIPLTEELVMADDTESEPESGDGGTRLRSVAEDVRERRNGGVEDDEDEDENDDEDDEGDEEDEGDEGDGDEEDDEDGRAEKKSKGSIYENENPSTGAGNTRMKALQQKVKVKADVLRAKLQGVTKRKPKQKIVVDAASNGEKSRRKLGQFATLPKKFTFNAAKVNFSTAFSNFAKGSSTAATEPEDESSGGAHGDDAKSGRFSLPRFGFTRTSSESPRPSKSSRFIGASRLSIPGFRSRSGSDASKVSKPDSPRSRIMDFGTYPRIFSKRRKTSVEENDETETPPGATESTSESGGGGKRKDSFRRRFFRSHHKESTPGPTGERVTATLAVEEELDEAHAASKESLAGFGDSDLQEVISLNDDCSRSGKDTKSLCSEHRPGVIEEIDSDEFFLREKGLSRGDVHISNYLSSEIRDMFRRSNRTRSVEGVNSHGAGHRNSNGSVLSHDDGVATPVRPSRTNSLRRPARAQYLGGDAADRFSTMPKSFGGSRPAFGKPRPDDENAAPPENIITSQTFESSSSSPHSVPSTVRVPWRTARKEEETAVVAHMPPKPPSRHQRMAKFSTFDTRSMIDLSRKRSQSQIGFLPSMNFSETVPKAPLRRSRTSLAGSDRDVSVTSDGRPTWVPTPPLRRSRMSLAAADLDAEDRPTAVAATRTGTTPPRPPPPRHMQTTQTAGYATVDKPQLAPPQSPARHRRKKSYDMIKSQEFGAFFTVPRSYSYGRFAVDKPPADPSSTITAAAAADKLPPARPSRAYNTLGPSRPHRRRPSAREHEYGDVADNDEEGQRPSQKQQQQPPFTQSRSLSLDDPDGQAKALSSGDVIEKMKLRPLPSPPPPPRKSRTAGGADAGSAQTVFLGQPDASATSSDDFFADVSRALAASSAAATAVASATATAATATTTTATPAADDDVSVAVQTDPLPDGYELDDLGSCCSAESDRPTSRGSSTARADHGGRPTSRTSTTAAAATASLTVDRPASRTSTTTEYVDRPASRVSAHAVENGYVMMPADKAASGGVICAQRISVNELQVGKMIVGDIRGQRMGVEDVSASSLKIAHLAAAGVMAPSLEAAVTTATAAVLQSSCDDDDDRRLHQHNGQDDDVSVHSSRVSSMYPEVDSDEDRASVLAAPTPPRRRSRPTTGSAAVAARRAADGRTCPAIGTAVDLSSPGPAAASAVDPSITELSCQLFRLCHSNVCSLFNKVVQQVVPEDTEKRRDLQAALCFLSIILAGLLILGFGNEKTIHHHHWDFQFPPPNQ